MPPLETKFVPLTEEHFDTALALLQRQAPALTREWLQKAKTIAALKDDQCVALAMIGYFPVNHACGWCHALNLSFADRSAQHALQYELIQHTTEAIISSEDRGCILGFSSADSDEVLDIPSNAYTAAGFKHLDASAEYRCPLPCPGEPEYRYRRTHQDTIRRFNPNDADDRARMDDLVSFANRIYDGILPNPSRRADKWQKALESDNQQLLFAVSPEGAITGLVEGSFSALPAVYICDIMVSFRRMATGLAVELVRRIEQIALKKGGTEFRVHVADWNRASQRLTESVGLKPGVRIERYIQEFGPTEATVQ